MRRTVVKNHRRWILVPLTVAAVGLAFASVAWACTRIVGSITTTAPAPNPNPCPNTGPDSSLCQVSAGTTITSTGSSLNVRRNPNTGNGALDPTAGAGAGDGTQWGLYFLNYKSQQDNMQTCMSSLPAGERKVGTGSAVQANNSVTISGPIPLTAQKSNSTTTPQGPALVCFISEIKGTPVPDYNYGTPATELAVL